MKALFISRNLIGDALYISPALRQWYREKGSKFERIDLLTNDDHVTRLYTGMGIPLNVITQESQQAEFYEFTHEFNVSDAFALSDQKKQHVAQSYADKLGVELPVVEGSWAHLNPTYELPSEDYPALDPEGSKPDILISMFSMSCTSQNKEKPGLPNKMVPWVKWRPILASIRREFPHKKIRFLGAPQNRAPEMLEIPESEYLTGIPLHHLAFYMRHCDFVLTLDNGMAHLAASQGAREFVLYPQCLGLHYILPLGNPQMRYCWINPLTITPVRILWYLRQAWLEWGLPEIQVGGTVK